MQALIQTPTPGLAKSKSYYETLEFEVLSIDETHFALAKNLVIQINDDRYARAGVKFIQENWKDFIQQNDDMIITETKTGWLTISPSGCPVYLEQSSPVMKTDLSTKRESVLGKFSGLGLETNSFEQSLAFWKRFGFHQNGGNADHGWISLVNNEGFGISVMRYNCCPHLFFNPSLSFFNGQNNLKIIDKIRTLQVTITEEITFFNPQNIVDNIIVCDPGGLGNFVFSD